MPKLHCVAPKFPTWFTWKRTCPNLLYISCHLRETLHTLHLPQFTLHLKYLRSIFFSLQRYSPLEIHVPYRHKYVSKRNRSQHYTCTASQCYICCLPCKWTDKIVVLTFYKMIWLHKEPQETRRECNFSLDAPGKKIHHIAEKLMHCCFLHYIYFHIFSPANILWKYSKVTWNTIFKK